MLAVHPVRHIYREWHFELQQKTVQLIRSPQDQLICRVFDRITGESKETTFLPQPGAGNVDQRAAQLMRDTNPEITRNRAGFTCTALFVYRNAIPIHTWLSPIDGNIEVRLSRLPSGQLFWIATNTVTNQTSTWEELGEHRGRLHILPYSEISSLEPIKKSDAYKIKFKEPIQVWMSNGKRIVLREVDRNLLLEVFDFPQGRLLLQENPAHLLGLEVNITKLVLQTRYVEVTMNAGDEVQIDPRTILYHQWKEGNGKIISLVWHDNKLKCRIDDYLMNASYLFEVTGMDHLPGRDERVTFLKNQKPKIVFDPAGRPLKIEFSPYTSILSPDKTLGVNQWAVTLVSCKETPEGHAALLIEGVDPDKGYFMHQAHLTKHKADKLKQRVPLVPGHEFDAGIVEIMPLQDELFLKENEWAYQYIHKEEIKTEKLYQHKTDTWVRERTQIQKLIDSIKKESQKGIAYHFIYQGGETILKETGKYYVEGIGIVERPADTALTKAVNVTVDGFLAVARPIVAAPMFLFDKLLLKPLSRFRQQPAPSSYPFSISAMGEISMSQANAEQALFHHAQNLRQQYGAERVRYLPSENCLTWATDQLGSIGIEVPENELDTLLAMSFGRWFSIPNTTVKFN